MQWRRSRFLAPSSGLPDLATWYMDNLARRSQVAKEHGWISTRPPLLCEITHNARPTARADPRMGSFASPLGVGRDSWALPSTLFSPY